MSPKLLVDATLGRLARWLRAIGYDTRYVPGEPARVAHEARREDRILLTQDRKLAHRRGLRVLVVTSQVLEEQLRQAVAGVGGLPEAAGPRCMECNAPLQSLSTEKARAHVPAYVAETQDVFHRCPECGKIYWRGSHWDGIERIIEESLPPSK